MYFFKKYKKKFKFFFIFGNFFCLRCWFIPCLNAPEIYNDWPHCGQRFFLLFNYDVVFFFCPDDMANYLFFKESFSEKKVKIIKNVFAWCDFGRILVGKVWKQNLHKKTNFVFFKIHILASLIAINSLTLWCDNYAEQRQKNIPTLFFGTDGHEEPFPIKVQLGLEWSLKYSEMSTFCFWSGYEVDFGNLMVEKNHWHIPDQRKILRKKCEKNIWKH